MAQLNLIRCPDEEEITFAVKVMKNNKAPGTDSITAELLKLGGDVVVQWLLNLVSVVWQEESVPEDWTKQLTIPLHKKGSFQDCDNYRCIALLSVPGKVFCKVLQTRLSKMVNHLTTGKPVWCSKAQGLCRPDLQSENPGKEGKRVPYSTVPFICRSEKGL